MKENYTVCRCARVNYSDIADALDTKKRFENVLEAFEDVQMATHCSTGCGRCYDSVLGIISEIMMGEKK